MFLHGESDQVWAEVLKLPAETPTGRRYSDTVSIFTPPLSVSLASRFIKLPLRLFPNFTHFWDTFALVSQKKLIHFLSEISVWLFVWKTTWRLSSFSSSCLMHTAVNRRSLIQINFKAAALQNSLFLSLHYTFWRWGLNITSIYLLLCNLMKLWHSRHPVNTYIFIYFVENFC